MRALPLFLSFILFSSYGFSQFGSDKRFSGGINIAPAFTNETPTLLLNWNPNPEKNKHSWIRTQVGFNSKALDGNRNSRTEFQQFFQNGPIDSTITTFPTRQWDLFLTIGFARSIDLNKGFHFYYATDILYGHGQRNESSKTEVVQTFNGSNVRQFQFFESSHDSHYDTYGIRTVAGFGFMPTERISFGLESSFGVKRSIHQVRTSNTSRFVTEFDPREVTNSNNSKDAFNTLEWFLQPLTTFSFLVHF
jgi:hypothetical protein